MTSAPHKDSGVMRLNHCFFQPFWVSKGWWRTPAVDLYSQKHC